MFKSFAGNKIDVLICASEKDIDFLLEQCIKSCIKNFELLGSIYIVTNSKEKLNQNLAFWDINFNEITVLSDAEVLGNIYGSLDGWYRQQLIKLFSDTVCTTKYICCLGADTIILRRVTKKKLFYNNSPILFYNRYRKPGIHLEYERKRIENISDVLGIKPKISYILGDFIMDFMIFDRDILSKLRTYLENIYGNLPYAKVVTNKANNYLEKTSFGEQTLYAVFALDVLHNHPRVKNSRNEFLAQLHSQADLDLFQFDSYIAHFVNKAFDKKYIVNRLELILEID